MLIIMEYMLLALHCRVTLNVNESPGQKELSWVSLGSFFVISEHILSLKSGQGKGAHKHMDGVSFKSHRKPYTAVVCLRSGMQARQS